MIIPRRLGCLVVLLAAATTSGLRGAEAKTPAGAAVQLPTYTVINGQFLPPPEKWRYATIPGFEILADVSDHATQRLINDFETFQQALGVVESSQKATNPAWPAMTEPASTVSLIVCGVRGKFDAFAPAGELNPETARASLFLRQEERNAIVIDLGTRIKGDGLPLLPKLVLREATRAEVGRIKGNAFLAAGYPRESAPGIHRGLYPRGRDPQLLGELGLSERTAGRDDRARKFLEIAVSGNVPRPRAYLELARLRAAELPAIGAQAKLTEEQAREITNPLVKARAFTPPRPEIYELMAAIWTQRGGVPKREEVAVLLEGVKLFPQRLGLVYQSACLARDAGLIEPAASLADYGLSVAPNAAA